MNKKKDLLDKLIGKDYKRLSRVFYVANIKYNERPPPAHTRGTKLGIENVTKKRKLGPILARKLVRR